eukprot:CFRG4837T1
MSTITKLVSQAFVATPKAVSQITVTGRVWTTTHVRSYQRNLHPRTYPMKVVMTDGSTFTIRSSMNGNTFQLNEDFKNTPPWKTSAKARVRDTTGNLGKFNRKFESKTKK